MTDPIPPAAVSLHFPFEVRQRLVKASQTPVTVADSMARVRAIDEAIEWAKLHFSELFRWPAPSA